MECQIKSNNQDFRLVFRISSSTLLGSMSSIYQKLCEAMKNGNVEMVENLILNSVVDWPKLNLTPLHAAVLQIQVPIARFLIDHGADLESQDIYGTPLHCAMYLTNHEEMVKLLVQKGAQFNSKNRIGRTPFHKAVNDGKISMANILLQYGADISTKDFSGNTPLHFAVYWRKEHVHFLLKSGASLKIRNKNGTTPLEYALTKDKKRLDLTKLIAYSQHDEGM